MKHRYLFSLLFGGCGFLSQAFAQSLSTPKIPSRAAPICKVVDLPGAENLSVSALSFDFRSLPGDGAFLVRTRPGPEVYTVDLTAHRPTNVTRHPDDAGWFQASGVSRPDDTRSPPYLRSITTGTTSTPAITSDGKSFARSGDAWIDRSGIRTRDNKWLALQSFSGTLQIGTGPFEPVRGRDRGKIYFDFFSYGDAIKLFTIEADFRDISPEALTGYTGWLAERFFIIPFGAKGARFLSCDLEAFESK